MPLISSIITPLTSLLFKIRFGTKPGSRRKRPGFTENFRARDQEQFFLENNFNNKENNSKISSVDLLRARSVSTGLELSLENPRLVSSGDSALHGLMGDDLDHELQRQNAEIDRYIRLEVGYYGH